MPGRRETRPMARPITLDTVRAAPKALLHDHLDGGLRPTTVIDIADEIGHTLPTTDPAALHRWFVRGAETRDLLRYLETFQHTAGVMQTEAHLARVARECVLDLAADGVVYAEVRYAPELHTERRLALDAVVEAVTAGIRDGEAAAARNGTPIIVNTILCAMRTEQRSLEIVELAVRQRDRDAKIVAFDLAGAETGFPPSLHDDALALARQHQMNLTIHASEPPDLELIADALAHGAHRIGHGVRLEADVTWHDDGTATLGPLAQHVLDRQIPLEMAPTCHVQVGAVASIAEHPFDRFRRLGMVVTVNTDNRLMSNVTVSGETLLLATTFGWGWDELGQVATNGIRSSFAPWELRQRLVRDVVAPAYEAARAG